MRDKESIMRIQFLRSMFEGRLNPDGTPMVASIASEFRAALEQLKKTNTISNEDASLVLRIYGIEKGEYKPSIQVPKVAALNNALNYISTMTNTSTSNIQIKQLIDALEKNKLITITVAELAYECLTGDSATEKVNRQKKSMGASDGTKAETNARTKKVQDLGPVIKASEETKDTKIQSGTSIITGTRWNPGDIENLIRCKTIKNGVQVYGNNLFGNKKLYPYKFPYGHSEYDSLLTIDIYNVQYAYTVLYNIGDNTKVFEPFLEHAYYQTETRAEDRDPCSRGQSNYYNRVKCTECKNVPADCEVVYKWDHADTCAADSYEGIRSVATMLTRRLKMYLEKTDRK